MTSRCSSRLGGPGDDYIKIVKPADGGFDSLEPCPFCGGTEVVYELYGHGAGERWRCWCTNCLASIDPGWAQDRHTVRDMWNRRPAQLNVPLTLEELLEMDGDPVWDKDGNCFIVRINVNRSTTYGVDKFATYTKLDILCERGLYRRKPEGGDRNA